MGQLQRRHRTKYSVKNPAHGIEAFALLEGPAVKGMPRRTLVYKSCLKAILDGRLPRGARLPSAR